jgi:hypothetical protein
LRVDGVKLPFAVIIVNGWKRGIAEKMAEISFMPVVLIRWYNEN